MMADFVEILSRATGHGNGQWKASLGGQWIYVVDGYIGQDGQVYTSKSRKGNPFMIRIHRDQYTAFVEFLYEVGKKLANMEDDIPF